MSWTCIWLPKWGGYMAVAKAGKFEYSQMLKSNQDLPSFIAKAKEALKGMAT